jgi:hypothetical protein
MTKKTKVARVVRAAKKPAAKGAPPVTDRDGRQLMVPGVPPAAAAPDDDVMTVATCRMTRGEMRQHRVALALAGCRDWQSWALSTLNAAAGHGGGR